MARFNQIGKAVGIAVIKDEQGIRSLLRRNGVSTNNITTKNELADVFIESLVASKGLAKDFAQYVKSKDNANFMNYNASGIYNSVVGDGVPDAYNMSGDESNTNIWSPSGSSTSVNADGENEAEDGEKKKGGFFAGLNLADLINQATEIYLKENERELAKLETTQIKEIANTTVNNDKFSPSSPPAKSSNTTLYVVLGVVGLALVGGVIYAVSKKK